MSNHDNLQQSNMLVEMVLDFVIGGLFVVVPLFWSGVLTWAGYKISNQMMNSVSEMNKTNNSAGSKGGNVVKQTATKGKM